MRRLNVLRNRVEEAIGREQTEKKRRLTDEEKEALMRREMSRGVVGVGRILWWDTPTPAIAEVPRDYGKVTVPEGDRATITKELQKRKQPVTDEAIAQWYLRGQAQGKWTP